MDNNPKTIDQIHKEVEKENQEKAFLSQQAQMQNKSQGGRGGKQNVSIETPHPNFTHLPTPPKIFVCGLKHSSIIVLHLVKQRTNNPRTDFQSN